MKLSKLQKLSRRLSRHVKNEAQMVNTASTPDLSPNRTSQVLELQMDDLRVNRDLRLSGEQEWRTRCHLAISESCAFEESAAKQGATRAISRRSAMREGSHLVRLRTQTYVEGAELL